MIEVVAIFTLLVAAWNAKYLGLDGADDDGDDDDEFHSAEDGDGDGA